MKNLFCNRVFQSTKKEATIMDVLNVADALLYENHEAFLERRALLTPKQWKFLIAIAKEGEVGEPTSGAFLQRHKLGAPSSVARLLASLTDKELLLETKTATGISYRVYNVFFSRWLERQ